MSTGLLKAPLQRGECTDKLLVDMMSSLKHNVGSDRRTRKLGAHQQRSGPPERCLRLEINRHISAEPNFRACLTNLLLLIGPPGKSSEGTQLRKFEMRFEMQPRHNNEPAAWLDYADPEVAPIRRSSSGSNTPILHWLDYGDHLLAPLRRSQGWPQYADP